jgi:hypothetical protein
MIKPAGGDWLLSFQSLLTGKGWPLASDSVIGTILNIGIEETRWFIDGVPTKVFIIDMTRILILLTFIGIGIVIYIAWKRKRKLSS